MSSTTLRACVVALAFGAALGLAACGDSSGRGGLDASPAPAAPSTAAAPASGSTSPTSSAHNDADVLFVQMSIPYHQQAVEMSEMLLAKKGLDPRVIDLAQQIKQASASDVAQMRGWLTGWGASATPSMDMRHDRVGSMVSKADMTKLEQATGTSSARLFLDDMIAQDQGDGDLTQPELDNGQNPDAKQLAQRVADSDKAQIKTMRAVLDDLR
jgi:uncharacterized protein (DUF305 family)